MRDKLYDKISAENMKRTGRVCLRDFLGKHKFIKEIASDRVKSYEAMKKKDRQAP